jgi:hypothetical protein
MNTLEEELRHLLADPPRPPLAGADAVGRVRAGIRRRQRRRAAVIGAGALTVVMVAAGVLTGVLVRGPLRQPQPVSPSPSASAIPWRDAPSVDYPQPSWSPRPDATPCRATDLTFDGVRSGAAMGTTSTSVRFHNDGPARCTLAGHPILLGRKNGTGAIGTVPTSAQTMMAPEPDQVPATIDPGEAGQVMIETHGGCLDGRAETTYDSLRLRLPDGAGDLTVPRMSINATCGVGLTVWHRPPASANPLDQLARLTVTIDVPDRIAVGAPLDFVVTLHNDTAADIPLDPCPNYLIFLQAPIKLGNGSHQLNCQVSTVPAGGEVRFAMHLDLPNSPDLIGETAVVWTLDVYNADSATNTTGPPSATASFTITP